MINYLKNLYLRIKVNKYEKIYFLVLTAFLILSCFISIPTDSTPIGISSNNLGIGDRVFYINESLEGFGYEDYSGNILYPYILKSITFITNFFGHDEYSKLWNLIIISISSGFSIFSLRLLRLSSDFLFDEKVSTLTCLIYIVNPYTYFYSLSGGITNYVFFGVTFVLFLFSKSYKNGLRLSASIYFFEIFLTTLVCIYLSFLRPSAGIFAFVILLLLLFENLKDLKRIKQEFKSKKFLNLFIVLVGLYCVNYNLHSVSNYISANIKLFAFEKGDFFGFPRELLREKLSITDKSNFDQLKSIFYYLLWKITDFVSGLSDIRDTHSAMYINDIMPFLMRVFTGIFILAPINLFSLIGLILNKRFIFKSGIWIVILSSFIAITPSLIGVAMSRYLIMFYPPFIIFSSKMIYDMFLGVKVANKKFL